MKSVGNRLADPAKYNSDTVIGAALALAAHSYKAGEISSLEVHLDGVSSAVDSRGGAKAITLPGLRLLPFNADTHDASMRDAVPRFPIPEEILPDISSLCGDTIVGLDATATIATWIQKWPTRGSIAAILYDVARVSVWVTRMAEHDSKFFAPANQCGRWLLPLLHRYLQLTVQGHSRTEAHFDDGGRDFQQVARHGVIIYLTQLRRAFNVEGRDFTLRLPTLRDVLLDIRQNSRWDGLQSLLLWATAVAGIEADNLEDQVGYVPQLVFLPRLNSTANHLGCAASLLYLQRIRSSHISLLSKLSRGYEALFGLTAFWT